jgi:hypothetical protein
MQDTKGIPNGAAHPKNKATSSNSTRPAPKKKREKGKDHSHSSMRESRTSIPGAVASSAKKGNDRFGNARDGDLVIKTCEMVGVLYANGIASGNSPISEELIAVMPGLGLPDPSQGTNAFVPVPLRSKNDLTPANSFLFPLASQSASQFELFQFRKLRFRFVPSASTDMPGLILMASDADSGDPNANLNAQSLMAFHGSVSTSVYKGATLEIDQYQLKKRGDLFIEDLMSATAGVINNATARQTSAGSFYLYGQFVPPNSSFGQLWVDYEVVLKNRQNDQTRVHASGIFTGIGSNLSSVTASTGMIFGYTGSPATGTSLPGYSQVSNKDCRLVSYKVGSTNYTGFEVDHPGAYQVDVTADGTGIGGPWSIFTSDPLQTIQVFSNTMSATAVRFQSLVNIVSSPAVIYFVTSALTTLTNVVVRLGRMWPGALGSGQDIVIYPSVVRPRAGAVLPCASIEKSIWIPQNEERRGRGFIVTARQLVPEGSLPRDIQMDYLGRPC